MISLALLPCAAPPGTKWTPVETLSPVRTLEELRDEVLSWTSARLSHGNLVRVVAPDEECLLVADTSGAFRYVPGLTATAWEREDATASGLILVAASAPPRQLAWCALALAKAVLHLADDPRADVAVEAAERFLCGKATMGEVRVAAQAAADAATWVKWAAQVVDAADGAAWATGWSDEAKARRAVAVWSQMAAECVWAVADAATRADPSASRAHADLARRFLPLPGVACARAGLPWPCDEVTT